MKVLFAIVVLTSLVGCAHPPASMPIGTAPHGVVDLREAQKTVRIYDQVPAGATNAQQIESDRCFMSYAQGEPTEDYVQKDLLILAFSKGATGISDFAYRMKGPGKYNCWHRLSGTATIFNP